MKIKAVKSIVIDRAKYASKTFANSRGCMCALGSYFNQCGIPKKILRPYSMTFSVRVKLGKDLPPYPPVMATSDAIENADKEERKRLESEIVAQFAAIGVKCKFKGRYVK
jgi:hypothetical protein